MNRTRVLLLFKALNRGGAEQLLVNAAQYLNRDDFAYEVAYIIPQFNALVGDLERLGLPVYCLEGTGGGAWLTRLLRLVRHQRTRIVHSHTPYVAIGSRIALKRPRGPLQVYTEHNVWEAYHPITRKLNRWTYPLNDHVFTVSDHVKQSIRYPASLGFLRRPPIETLYHGLDPAAMAEWEHSDGVRESLGIPPEVPVIGTVSNFRAEKGHRYLLEAAVRVLRDYPDARFVLVGHGPMEKSLRRQVHQLGLQDSVIFTGARSDAPRLAASFDVFALPSIHEGLSIALVEALAVGTPAVVTRAGGVTEVVRENVTGVVVPPGNPVALGDAIVTVLGDPALRRRLTEAGRLRAADFDIRRAVNRIEDVYRELLP